MDHVTSACPPATLSERLVRAAIARDVPPEVARAAARATVQALRLPESTSCVRPQQVRRAESYFNAVVRRRVVRRGAPAQASARFVLASVVEDLRAAGRDERDIWQELERGWVGQVPDEVLEEYRLRLCG